MHRGDVVTIPFPFTNQAQSKLRPAVLVTNVPPAVAYGVLVGASGVALDGHFIYLSSRPQPIGVPTLAIRQGSAEARAMGLRFDPSFSTCFVAPTKIATVELRLARTIGRAPPSVMKFIEDTLRSTLGL